MEDKVLLKHEQTIMYKVGVSELATLQMTSLMNNRLFITSIVIATILLLHGCGAVRENRIRQDVLADTHMPEEMRRAIDQKELVVGMTKEQVIASWGLPCKWCYGTRRSPSGDTWEYNLFGSDFVINGSDIIGIGNGIYLFFDSNGTLRYWSNQ